MFGSSGGSGGGFSFGNNSNNSGSGTGFSFGGSSNNNASTPATSTGASGGLFGNKPSSFSFGSSNNNNNTSTSNTSGGGLFGNKAQNTGSGLFGTNNANNANNANSTNTDSTGGGLFGNANNNTANAANTGGLFGGNNTSLSNTSGGLFGNKPATTGTSTGGLFGGNNASTNATNTGTTGSLFGNKSGTSTGSLFGNNSTNTNTNTTTNTSGGLFGNNSNNNSSNTTGTAASGGLFGSNNATNNANNQANPGGLFNSNQSTSNQPSFAWTQNQNSSNNQLSSFKSNPTINALQLQHQQQQQQQNLDNYSNTIIEQLLKIKNSWDPNSPTSLLNTYFYNKVPENEVLRYVKPPNVSQEEWNLANSKKPGDSFVAVKASGFEDLEKRSAAQTNHVAQSRLILKEIETKTKSLGDKHDLDSTTRITNCKNRHQQLSKKLLILGCKLSILKSRGYPLSPEEEILSENFNKLTKVINDPVGLGRINELWSRLAILKERSELLRKQLNNSLVIGKNNLSGGDEIYSENEGQVNKIIKVLQKQQAGIQYLSEVLEKDGKTVDELITEKSK